MKALTIRQDEALTTTDVMTAFGALLRLYVADGDASPETIRSYSGNAAQFVEAARLEGLRPILAPHWRKDRHGQPRYLYLIHSTQDPSTSPFDFTQDEFRAGSAPASESTSAPTPKPGLQPWPVSKPGMNSRPSRTRCAR